MQRALFSILLSFAAASGVSLAQERPDAARLLSEARENLRTYGEEARLRQADLSRKIEVLRMLGEVGDQISTFSTGISLDKARGKLADARHLAETDPPLSEPVPTVLAAVDELLNRSGVASPEQIKARVFVAVSRLEEHVVQQVALLESDSHELENMERGLHSVQSGLRSVVSNGMTTVIYVRRLAAK